MNRNEVRVWDPLVRVLHWSLVLLVAAAWASAEEAERLHEVLGFTVAALIALRLQWGLVGTRHARFADFVRPPRAALTYLVQLARGRSQRFLGHNPAGGLSVLALLAALVLVSVSGWATTYGPFAGAHWVAEVHEGGAALLGMLVALHVAGVVVASLAGGENLVRAMITGKKRAPEECGGEKQS